MSCQQAASKGSGKGSVSGRDAFVLYDTYGFPLEITEELAAAQGITVDFEGFTQEMQVCPPFFIAISVCSAVQCIRCCWEECV